MADFKQNKDTHPVNCDPYDPDFDTKMKRWLEWRKASCHQCDGRKVDIDEYCKGCNLEEFRRSNGERLIPENARISITEKGEHFIKSTLMYWIMKPRYEKSIKKAIERGEIKITKP